MPDPSRLALFVGAALLLLVVPGPSVLYIVTQSVAHGRRAGLVSVAGHHDRHARPHRSPRRSASRRCSPRRRSPFDVVKYLGAAYLIVRRHPPRSRGRRARAGAATPSARATSAGSTARGSSSTSLNPKTALFFLAFLPQFVDPARGAAVAQILALGLLFAALGFLSDGVWALVAGTLGERLRRSRRFPRSQRYVSGSVFVGLGAVAALTAPVKQT